MGGGRVKALIGCIGAVALATGCGVEEHENTARPQAPTRISVAVSDDQVTVQPRRIGVGQEPTQQVPQNQNAPQPQVQSDEPLALVVVAVNLTDSDTRLLLRGPSDAVLDPLFAHSNGTLAADLESGVYTVTAEGLPKARPGKLVVGSYRTSSQNNVLLP